MSDAPDIVHILLHENLERKSITLSRGDMLLRAGEVERAIYYIVSGAIHAFYVSDKAEHSIRFGYKNSLITSIPSFYDQRPSEVYLQAIRKTEVIAITRDSFMRLKDQDERLRQLYARSLELLAGQQMEREIDLLTASPSERVQRVLDRSPAVFQEIPSKYIASYLRMTPETLSRILNS